ncbi:MAG: UDP-N-acetylmuramoyl-L-alanyl-D-glutamate--2,6-diaminopimelate ligase [Actinomycetota bacterium]|nr:UDP-N-acetylmuramoyl-L-alanyl-D-glutamate--2,6-diaminopimelate ligase [Actinomycetota bacterium]
MAPPTLRVPEARSVTITLPEVADAAASVRSGPVERRGDAVLTDATHDSRQVRPGWLYCAIPGATVDGHDFCIDAVDAGAPALLVERFVEVDVPQVRVPSVRRVLGPVAARVHGHPSDRLTVVGVTGTNGKTTTTYLLESAFGAGAVGTGVVGTIETRIHGQPQPGVRTTPEATDVQRLLATMYARGVDAVAMEVSSHGLAQHRVDGTRFAAAVFTNLSQEHLDFHGNLEDYFAAKARLFTPQLAEVGIVCVDDQWGQRLADIATIPVVTYGRCPDADVRIVDVDSSMDGVTCRLVADHAGALPGGPAVTLTTRLIGAYNTANAAAAYLAATRAGVPPDAAAAGIADCPGIPGRLEPVDRGQPFAVLVDYAHTPDALSRAVAEVDKLIQPGRRVHVVVGCGGDRDVGKRPVMGRVAAEGGRAVLTSDNPRSEDPVAILAQVEAGARRVHGADVVVEPDRRAAIAAAIAGSEPGDVVLIAGKGHETYQEFADRTVPFDDREVAAEVLAARGWRRQTGGRT